MYDATVAMTDIVMNFWSLGVADELQAGTGLIDTFAASDGHFVLQVVREHHFEALAHEIGHPEWLADPRLATRAGWAEHGDGLIRDGIEAWAANDEHLRRRNMIVEMPRSDGEPVMIPGNPVKMSAMPEGPESRVPWLGEHTDAVLGEELALDPAQLADLRQRGIIG